MQDENQKRFVDGAGSFQDLNGNKNINSSTIVKPWSSENDTSLIIFGTLFTLTFCMSALMMLQGNNITINGVLYNTWSEALRANPVMYIFTTFPILGLAVLYAGIVKNINKTTYKIVENKLSITHSPLPWPKKNSEYTINEIVQIYIQKREQNSDGRSTTTFRIMAQMKNDSDQIIENSFNNYSDAKILEQWLENKLNIQDVSVPGEVES